jgi:regulator of protease activity HflC (stomatin/prohibitin superfamily)
MQTIDHRVNFAFSRNMRWIVAIPVALFLVSESYYTVDPTQMAGVRRLGTVITAQPVGDGLHFKAPFIDTVDKVTVSLQTYTVPRLVVNTIDNQPVQLAVGVTYTTPPSAVLHLLYEVGGAGNADIEDNLHRIIADRTAKIFAQQNTTTISENREKLSGALRAILSEDLRRLYGIEVQDLQVADIVYSDSFRASVEAAVKAKNDSVASENMVNKVRYDGEQAKVRAAAEAAAAISRAEGEKQAAILAAEGQAEATKLQGDAQAEAIRAQGKALSESPRYVDYAVAKAWNGQPPQTILGGQGAVPFFQLTKPAGQ